MDVTENLRSQVKNMEKRLEKNLYDNTRDITTAVQQRDKVAKDTSEDHLLRGKKRTKGEVVLIMDSNRQYIKHDKFWNGHSCKIMRAGDINAGKKILLEYDFNEAKMIYIHLGTNDIEKIENMGKSKCRDYNVRNTNSKRLFK